MILQHTENEHYCLSCGFNKVTGYLYSSLVTLIVVAWILALKQIDLSNTSSVGSHASDWSLAIHFHTKGWSLAWLLACLFSTLVHQVRGSWKSQAASAIDQASDWLLAIHFIFKRLVACTTRCGIWF